MTENISQNESRDEKYENQISDFKYRRHTVENGAAVGHRDLAISKMELTTQKIRQEYSEIHKSDQYFDEIKEKYNQQLLDESKQFCPINDNTICDRSITATNQIVEEEDDTEKQDEKTLVNNDTKSNQSKKKRRKKSMIKKKNSQQRKNSSSSNSSASFSSEKEEIGSNEASPSSENDINSKKVGDDNNNSGNDNEDSVKTAEHTLSDIHFFSDGEIGTSNLQQSRSLSPVQSDTEFEISQRENYKNSQIEWKWGQPIVKTDDNENITNSVEMSKNRNSMISGMLDFMKQKRKNNAVEGLFLADLDLEDPEIAAVYFPPNNKSMDRSVNIKYEEQKRNLDDDHESGNGTSVPQSPSNSVLENTKINGENINNQSTDFSLNFISLSLCGGMDKEGGPSTQEFESNIVQFDDVCQNPLIFTSPNLVVRINNKYFSWNVACSYIMTLVAFQKELPLDVCEKINESHKMSQVKAVDVSPKEEGEGSSDSNKRSWFLWRRSGGGGAATGVAGHERLTKKLSSTTPVHETHGFLSDLPKSSDELELTKSNYEIDGNKLFTDIYRKTLRLNSKQIESLNLKSGLNEAEFSVTTAYQGTSRCKCFIFLWKYNDKVVISDIDGK